jgi:WD40 repeat protein
VRCFDVQTGFAHVSPLGHHEVVSALALNEDGDSILSASHDGTIRTARVNDTMDVRNSTMVFDWNTVTWDKVKLWWVVPHDYCVGQEAVIDMTNHFFRKKHSKSLMCMAFSRRLKTIAFGTYNGVLGILNLDEETLEFANMADANNYGKGHWDTIWQVRFSNTSALLASSGGAGDPGIKLWDLQRRDLLSVFHVGECRDFVFSGDDRWLINADDKGKICKWEVGGDGRQPTQQIELKADSKILALEIDYEQKLFATGDNKGYVRLWNAETLEEEACVNVHQSEIWALRFSYHGGHLATAGNDGSIALINVRRGTPTFGVCNRVFMDKGACAGMLASGLRGKDHGFVEKVAVMLREYGAKI